MRQQPFAWLVMLASDAWSACKAQANLAIEITLRKDVP
jgi:hypothetical protein